MNVAELISELRPLTQNTDVWVRINLNGHGMLDIAAKVYVDGDGDVVIEGEAE